MDFGKRLERKKTEVNSLSLKIENVKENISLTGEEKKSISEGVKSLFSLLCLFKKNVDFSHQVNRLEL